MKRIAACAVLLTVSLACGGSRSVTVVMNAENNSGQKGVAVITEVPGGTRVTVDVTSGPDTRSQLMHIHPGTCGEIGAIFRGLAPLTLQPDGGMHSETVTDAGFDLLTASNHAINAHFPDDFSLYTTCGNLKK